MSEDRSEARRRLRARALMFASMPAAEREFFTQHVHSAVVGHKAVLVGVDSPEPPGGFSNGFEARAWMVAAANRATHAQAIAELALRGATTPVRAEEERAAEPHCVQCGGAHPPLVMPCGTPPCAIVSDVEREALASALPRRVRHQAQNEDAFVGAGAVYVTPELVPQVEPRAHERRMACGCVPRFELVEACAAVAEQVEREALGSPVAQDAARRIKLAILALR